MKPDQVRRLALALPEAVEIPHFALASFRIRGKIFACLTPDGAHLHLFVAETERETALAMQTGGIEKLFWGKQCVGLRLRLDSARAEVVGRLLRQAWHNKSPKRLSATIDQ